MAGGEFYRVLIVDDEQLIRKGIVHYMDWEKEGFLIVGEASNGYEALEVIDSINPDIVITDIVMPIMDGEELTRMVKERYPHIEIIILSSFSEFDYVRSTFQNGVVDYILKPKLDAQSLLKGLKKAANRIPPNKKTEFNSNVYFSIEKMINKLILGYEIPSNREDVLKVFPFHCFYLLGVDIKNHSSRNSADLKTIVKEKIVDELSLNFKEGVYYSVMANKNLIVILINMEKNRIQDMIQFIGQLAGRDTGFGFALSEEFCDLFQIGKVFKEQLIKLLNYRFYLSENPLLLNKDLPESQVQMEPFNLDWFTEELKSKRFNSAFDYLKNHSTRLSCQYTNDIFEYKAFFSNIIFNITILLCNMGYDVKELDQMKYLYLRSFEEIHTAQEAILLLDSFVGKTKKCLLSSQTNLDNLNLKKLVEFMKKHYAESLTLTEMANHFHFNPSYLSNYFSTHMHEGFVEYLNKLRIEAATKLLMEGASSISEISGMVGFSDHSYFCKVFKKIKGLSPSQYKRKYS